MTMRQSWRVTRAHGWRLCGIFALVSLQETLTAHFLLQLTQQFTTYLLIGIGIAALSMAYTLLLGSGEITEA